MTKSTCNRTYPVEEKEPQPPLSEGGFDGCFAESPSAVKACKPHQQIAEKYVWFCYIQPKKRDVDLIKIFSDQHNCKKQPPTNCRGKVQRSRADSNRCRRFCRPVPSLSATRPFWDTNVLNFTRVVLKGVKIINLGCRLRLLWLRFLRFR